MIKVLFKVAEISVAFKDMYSIPFYTTKCQKSSVAQQTILS